MAKEKRTRDEVVGDILLDLSKITFGGIVIAGIFESGTNRIMLVSGAVIFCLALIFTGIFLITNKK